MSEHPMFTPSEEGASTDALTERREYLRTTTEDALATHNLDTLSLILNGQHPADLAAVFRHLDAEDQQQALSTLSESLAADTLAEMDLSTMRSVTGQLDDGTLADLVEEMEPDDAADILADLPAEQTKNVLNQMEAAEAAEVQTLMTHAEDSGGGIMTSRLVTVLQGSTVAEAIQTLQQRAETEDEEVYYLYVVDRDHHLLGMVPLKQLLFVTPDTPILNLIKSEPITARTDMDQEAIAHLFSEYDLLALPVIDADDKLVGRITIDDIVDVIKAEATEDIYEMAAITSEAKEKSSAWGSVQSRLPWLLVCLAGTLLSGGVLEFFSETLAQVSILVVFVPAIMAMGGNAGIQTATVTVRNLATGDLASGEILMALFREMRIALGMGHLLGLIVFGVAYTWSQNIVVGIGVGLAMGAAVIFSALLGALVPLLFRRLGFDPAVASGPLITTLNDIVSLTLYFSIAVALLQRWG